MKGVFFLGWYKKAKKKAKKYGRKAIRGGKWLGRRTPYGRVYTYGSYVYRHRRKIKQSYDTVKEGYDKYRSRRRKTSPKSSSRAARRRGKYYYYRGKRYYRKRRS